MTELCFTAVVFSKKSCLLCIEVSFKHANNADVIDNTQAQKDTIIIGMKFKWTTITLVHKLHPKYFSTVFSMPNL